MSSSRIAAAGIAAGITLFIAPVVTPAVAGAEPVGITTVPARSQSYKYCDKIPDREWLRKKNCYFWAWVTGGKP